MNFLGGKLVEMETKEEHTPTRCHAAGPVRRLVQFILVNEDKFTEYDPDGVKKHTLAALRAEMEKP